MWSSDLPISSHMLDCFKYTAASAAASDTMAGDRSRAMRTAGTSDNMQRDRGRKRKASKMREGVLAAELPRDMRGMGYMRQPPRVSEASVNGGPCPGVSSVTTLCLPW